MYLDYFGMRELPFTLTPNTEFFFNLEGHHKALEQIRSALRRGEKFIKITGEVGTGKTLLCRHILQDISDRYLCVFIPNPYLTPRSVLLALMEELSIYHDGQDSIEELFSLIRDNLLEHKKAGKQLVFLIDEAQAMSDESILVLARLTAILYRDRPLVQIALFGQPELDDMLASPSLKKIRHELSVSYSLPLLTEVEVSAYLQHRLAKAGSASISLFTPRAAKELSTASKGVPRLINVLAHKSLIVAYGRDSQQVNHVHVRRSVEDTAQIHPLPKMNLWADLTTRWTSMFMVAMFSSSVAFLAVYMMVLS